MGIFTGDFVFVGSIGRPDLLETAAGVVGSAEVGARQLYHSTRRFRELPDHLQVWPAHGAGSACGKGLGAIPSSTVGYEKLFNPALQFDDEQEFVDYILTDQPETPFYFAVMKRVNKVGPELTEELGAVSESISPTELRGDGNEEPCHRHQSRRASLRKSHVPGTINVPASNLVQWAGFFVDYNQPVFLIADEGSLSAQLRSLRSIGIDNVGGYFDAGAVKSAGLRTESYRSATPARASPTHRGRRRDAPRRARGNGISGWAHRRRRAPFPRHAVAEHREPFARTSRWWPNAWREVVRRSPRASCSEPGSTSSTCRADTKPGSTRDCRSFEKKRRQLRDSNPDAIACHADCDKGTHRCQCYR